jgi:hypothetical protein
MFSSTFNSNDTITISGTGVLTQTYVKANLKGASSVYITGFSSIGVGAFYNATSVESVTI